ncbi:3-oxoacyl-ACP synthase [Musicola paradisiaca]|uniref:3-Oxoacyl-(Acyl-carrier-protein (ACP)) synthase III domain protein n=1 Tax=Musicola paradisiaca (strain Ech703) TaxID=579405 RepID=C6C6K1_MUSP7|nr:3-oxoacyl-ACP synthase [Musicola paradisiaca]ACS83920.1 3-Oxoacyl-(acyl-carrier-protein (ACP)) synthase III domain protein [Musicola paradisiaca Ech703]
MRLTHFVNWIPENRISAAEIITQSGASPSEARVFSQLFGFRQVAALDGKTSVEQVLFHLLDRLQQEAPQPALPADTLIYVHGMPVQHPDAPGWSARLRAHPFITPDAACYELDQQNCATLFWAFDLARRLLAARQARRIAIVAGDTLSTFPPEERYVAGCTLVGDAFSALLLEEADEGLQIGPIFLAQRPEFHAGIHDGEQAKKDFYQAHDELVSAALLGAGVTPHEQPMLLPHNVNRISWLNYSRRHHYPMESIALGLMPDIGHCYTTDSLLLLQMALPAVLAGTPHVMLSVGLGAWIGSCRLFYV